MGHTSKAAALARIAHAGMKYGDEDYFARHVEDVANRVAEDRRSTYGHLTIAYLHDVVEDTEVSLDDLRLMEFPEIIVEAVDALTRRDGEDYLTDYMLRVSKNAPASLVKYHDLRANTNSDTRVSLARRNMKALEMLTPFVELTYGAHEEGYEA